MRPGWPDSIKTASADRFTTERSSLGFRKTPAAAHRCDRAQHATTRSYLSCQRVLRRPGRWLCTRPTMRSDMTSLSIEKSETDNPGKHQAVPMVRLDGCYQRTPTKYR